MTTPLKGEQLQALARMANLPEGNALKALLTLRLADYDTALRNATGEEIIRCQGRAQAVAELLKDIEGARAALQRTAPSARPFQAPESMRM